MGKRPELIGGDGEPVRAVTFAGGGFGTALQLGVTHALLVSRGEAPDLGVIFEWHILGPLLGLAVLASLPLLLRSRTMVEVSDDD